MSDLKRSIIIDLAGNAAQRARRLGGSLQGLGRRGTRSLGALNRTVSKLGRGIDRLGNRYTALATGAAGIGTIRMVATLEERFGRLGIQANASADEMEKLKRKVYDVARAPQIRVDPGEITSAIAEIVEKTGDLKFAENNIVNIGKAIQATGASGGSIGGIMAEFQKMGIIDPKQILEALDILTVQGKEGAFTLEHLAKLGPRVVTAYTSMGRGGVGAIREMGAALQIIRQGTGSSEMAATAFEAVMRTLSDSKKLDMLRKGGLKIFDPEAAKDGKKVLRPINELMAEIIQKTKGDKEVLSKVFDAEALRAFNAAGSEFQRTGGLASLDKFMKVQADGTVITKDSARAAEFATSAWQNLLTTLQGFADRNLSGPLKSIAETMNGLDPQTSDKLIGGAAVLAGGLGALVAGRKVFNLGRGLFGKGKGGGGLEGLSGGMGGPIPVYVVNDRMSLLDMGMGGGKGKGAGGKLPGIGGRLAKFAPLAGKAGMVGAAGAAGYGIGTGLNNLAGMLSGKIFGDEYSGKGWLGKLIYDAVNGGPNSAPQTAAVTVKVETDSGARARVTGLNSENMQLDVDSGPMSVGDF